MGITYNTICFLISVSLVKKEAVSEANILI